MKKIQTSNGFDVLVDDEDYNYLIQFSWKAKKDRNTYYAYHRISVNGKQKDKSMHRHFIMNTPDGLQVDHIDRNGLNNQRSNLRNVMASVNCHNVKARSNTGYLGVHRRQWLKKNGVMSVMYTASIGFNNKTYSLGNYKLLSDAVRTYNDKAIEFFGDNANINLI